MRLTFPRPFQSHIIQSRTPSGSRKCDGCGKPVQLAPVQRKALYVTCGADKCKVEANRKRETRKGVR